MNATSSGDVGADIGSMSKKLTTTAQQSQPQQQQQHPSATTATTAAIVDVSALAQKTLASAVIASPRVGVNEMIIDLTDDSEIPPLSPAGGGGITLHASSSSSANGPVTSSGDSVAASSVIANACVFQHDSHAMPSPVASVHDSSASNMMDAYPTASSSSYQPNSSHIPFPSNSYGNGMPMPSSNGMYPQQQQYGNGYWQPQQHSMPMQPPHQPSFSYGGGPPSYGAPYPSLPPMSAMQPPMPMQMPMPMPPLHPSLPNQYSYAPYPAAAPSSMSMPMPMPPMMPPYMPAAPPPQPMMPLNMPPYMPTMPMPPLQSTMPSLVAPPPMPLPLAPLPPPPMPPPVHPLSRPFSMMPSMPPPMPLLPPKFPPPPTMSDSTNAAATTAYNHSYYTPSSMNNSTNNSMNNSGNPPMNHTHSHTHTSYSLTPMGAPPSSSTAAATAASTSSASYSGIPVAPIAQKPHRSYALPFMNFNSGSIRPTLKYPPATGVSSRHHGSFASPISIDSDSDDIDSDYSTVSDTELPAGARRHRKGDIPDLLRDCEVIVTKQQEERQQQLAMVQSRTPPSSSTLRIPTANTMTALELLHQQNLKLGLHLNVTPTSDKNNRSSLMHIDSQPFADFEGNLRDLLIDAIPPSPLNRSESPPDLERVIPMTIELPPQLDTDMQRQTSEAPSEVAVAATPSPTAAASPLIKTQLPQHASPTPQPKLDPHRRIHWKEVDRYMSRFLPPKQPLSEGVDPIGKKFSFTSLATIITPSSNHPPTRSSAGHDASSSSSLIKNPTAAMIAKDITTALRSFQAHLKNSVPKLLAANRATICASVEQEMKLLHNHEQPDPTAAFSLASIFDLPFLSITQGKEYDMPKRVQNGLTAAQVHIEQSCSHNHAHRINTAIDPSFASPLTNTSRPIVHPISLSIWNAPSLLEAESRDGQAYITSEESRAHTLPERISYTTVRRNIVKPDDKQLHYVPYFGDEGGDTVDPTMYATEPPHGGDENDDDGSNDARKRDTCILRICTKYGDSANLFKLLAKEMNTAFGLQQEHEQRHQQSMPKRRSRSRTRTRNHRSHESDQDSASNESDSSSSSSPSSTPSSPPSSSFTPHQLRTRWQQLTRHRDQMKFQQFQQLMKYGLDLQSVGEAVRKVEETKDKKRREQEETKMEIEEEEEKKEKTDKKSTRRTLDHSSLSSPAIHPEEPDLFSHPSSSKLNLLSSYQQHFCRRCFVYECNLHGHSQPRRCERSMPSEKELNHVEKLGLQGAKRDSPTNTKSSTPKSTSLTTSTPPSSSSSAGPTPRPCGSHCFRLALPKLRSIPVGHTSSNSIQPCSDQACSIISPSSHSTATSTVCWSEAEKMILRKLIYVHGPAATTTTTTAPEGTIQSFPYCTLATLLGSKTCAEIYHHVDRTSVHAPFLTHASHRAQLTARNPPSESNESMAKGGKKRKRGRTRAALQMRLKADFRRSLRHLPHASVACSHPGRTCAGAGDDCPCMRNQLFCEKFCACGGNEHGRTKDCANRFIGCNCHGIGVRCQTRACSCYAANRECDPDLCRSCDIVDEAAIDEFEKGMVIKEETNSYLTASTLSPSSPLASTISSRDASPSFSPVLDSPSNAVPALLPSSAAPRLRHCQNTALQTSTRHCLLLGESDVHGWGCFLSSKPHSTAPTVLRKHDFITEYFGEIISQEEADRRGKIYDRSNRSYLFNLNAEYVVDAARKGNKIKYANHSRQPNCYSKVVTVNGSHRIGIYAQKPIKPGDELLFDYQHEHSGTTPSWLMEKGAAGEDAPPRRSTHQSTAAAAAAAAGRSTKNG